MAQARQVSVLVVDDEETSRWGLALLLSREGYLTDQAVDGRHAMEKLSLSEYDVIITDLRMPRMDGLELIKAVGDRYAGRIILLTAYGSTDAWFDAMGHGVFEYINKPIDYSHLLQIIQTITDGADPTTANR